MLPPMLSLSVLLVMCVGLLSSVRVRMHVHVNVHVHGGLLSTQRNDPGIILLLDIGDVSAGNYTR